MPVETVALPDAMGLLFICRGVLSGRELVEATQGLLDSAPHRAPFRYGIVDGTNISRVAELSTADLRTLAEMHKRLADAHPKSGEVVAVVAPLDVFYGLSRMWSVFAEGTGWEIASFRSRAEADAWIRQRMREKHGLDLPRAQSATA